MEQICEPVVCIKLVCPYTQERLEEPVYSKGCNHLLHAMSKKSYLEFKKKYKTKKCPLYCPHCKRDMLDEEPIPAKFLQGLLDKLPAATTRVYRNKNKFYATYEEGVAETNPLCAFEMFGMADEEVGKILDAPVFVHQPKKKSERITFILGPTSSLRNTGRGVPNSVPTSVSGRDASTKQTTSSIPVVSRSVVRAPENFSNGRRDPLEIDRDVIHKKMQTRNSILNKNPRLGAFWKKVYDDFIQQFGN